MSVSPDGNNGVGTVGTISGTMRSIGRGAAGGHRHDRSLTTGVERHLTSNVDGTTAPAPA
jgi:hypothetical protein